VRKHGSIIQKTRNTKVHLARIADNPIRTPCTVTALSSNISILVSYEMPRILWVCRLKRHLG
jgi:hypothetical protein